MHEVSSCDLASVCRCLSWLHSTMLDETELCCSPGDALSSSFLMNMVDVIIFNGFMIISSHEHNINYLTIPYLFKLTFLCFFVLLLQAGLW